MTRRLKTIARWINENLSGRGYSASVSDGYCDTSTKVGRLRWPGKGRYGNHLMVWHKGEMILSHNSAETYRTNAEVESWLKKLLKEMGETAK